MRPLRIEFGVADAPGHKSADRGVRIGGVKAQPQLRIAKPHPG
jgi:hypothetical protein